MCSRSVSELLSPSLSSSSSANFKFPIYLLILLTSVQLIDAFCDKHQWWQEQLDECIPCTVCDASKSIVLRPCQKHSDTVCGTLDDVELELDWIKAAAVSAHHKQVEEHQHLGVIEKSTATMLMWDWQSLSLALAGLMCLLFFIVAACIYWQHSHYWKKLEQMERRYNAEAEELSSRLMHTIIDIRNDDSGRVVLEEAKRDKITNPFDLQCIYFEELLNNDGTNRAPVPKPLIKTNPKKHQPIESKVDLKQKVECETNTIKERPIEDETVQKQGRGNCYTEPMHQNNCVTSELYMLT
ncbi:tumor necrosis factor receptor superfamily member wengen [Sitodiplosis mosellana]|uniref:tumor necrosis factor receptor superfamily member wengen n=1 Tax=Sitodiplosis mosellana TaxID=263140 RepID=UPI0024450A59|nr:tumor necrosis factor receptor superfamily member wengen [Sitodiplosis mosellana]XP_055307686.1 tumor necrosis factor receptor superfamily member wengen [Sitodiplosis mosellana]